MKAYGKKFFKEFSHKSALTTAPSQTNPIRAVRDHQPLHKVSLEKTPLSVTWRLRHMTPSPRVRGFGLFHAVLVKSGYVVTLISHSVKKEKREARVPTRDLVRNPNSLLFVSLLSRSLENIFCGDSFIYFLPKVFTNCWKRDIMRLPNKFHKSIVGMFLPFLKRGE